MKAPECQINVSTLYETIVVLSKLNVLGCVNYWLYYKPLLFE